MGHLYKVNILRENGDHNENSPKCFSIFLPPSQLQMPAICPLLISFRQTHCSCCACKVQTASLHSFYHPLYFRFLSICKSHRWIVCAATPYLANQQHTVSTVHNLLLLLASCLDLNLDWTQQSFNYSQGLKTTVRCNIEKWIFRWTFGFCAHFLGWLQKRFPAVLLAVVLMTSKRVHSLS